MEIECAFDWNILFPISGSFQLSIRYSIGNLTGFRFSTDHLEYNGYMYTYMYGDRMMEGAHRCISN